MIKAIKNLFWLIKPCWKYGKLFVITHLISMAVIFPILDLVAVYAPQLIVDLLEAGNPFGEVVRTVALVYGAMFLCAILVDILASKIKHPSLERIELHIKRDIYLHAAKMDYRYIDDPAYYNDYMWAFDNYADKSRDAFVSAVDFFEAVVTISALSAVIATVNPMVVVVTLISTVLALCISNRVNKIAVKMDDDTMPHNRRLGYFHRVFYMNAYAGDLKSTRLIDIVLKKYDRTKDDKVDIIKKAAGKELYWTILARIVRYLGKAISILYVAHGIYTGDVAQIGAYITVFLAIDRLEEYLFMFSYSINEGHKFALYAARIRKFFELKSEIEVKEGGVTPATGSFSVELKDLDFKYDRSGFGLKKINLKIRAGERVAIVGENGAGKSTLVKLLLRLYDVTGGDILINGVSIKDYDIAGLRKRIGVAFQNPNAYALSFAENIGLYHEADAEKLSEISEALGLNGILQKNNAGFSAEVTKEFDEDGIALSGGEVQKIGLARLMTGDFGLLLLDEPSSALDPLAEYEMNKMILGRSNASTTIIVAHRLSTIRDADRIVLVDDGAIKEIGTHDELMALNGTYCEMFTKQAENYVK